LEEYLEIGKGTGLKHMDCEWKFKSDSGKGSCTEAGVKWKDEDLGEKKIWYTMRNESGFYDDLLSTTGVQKEWIYWDDEYSTETPCLCVPGSQVCDCDRVSNLSLSYPKTKCCIRLTLGFQNAMRRYNFPRRLKDKKKIEVANPKAIVDAAIPEMDKLSNIALVAYWDMQTGSGNSNNQDVLLSLSTPVFMLQEASKSIKEIKDIGEEQKETKTRDLVFLILSIVFTVIPFAGEAAKLLGGAAALARVALLVGEAGNAGLLLAEVAEDPDSAPWLMLGALLGAVPGAGSGSRQSFKNAADIRRKLDDPSGPGLTKFSKEFQRKDGMVQNIVKKCLY
jgi:chitinase